MPDSGGALPAVTRADLPRLDAAEAALRRRLFRRRGPVQASVAQRPASLRCLGEASDGAGTDSARDDMCFGLTIGEGEASLAAPRALIERLLTPLGIDLDGLDGEMAGMLLERALAEILPGLERLLGHEIVLARRATLTDAPRLRLRLQCTLDGTTFDLVLALDARAAGDLCVLLERMPAERGDLSHLTAVLTAAVGSAILPVQDIDDLVAGDVILPHSPPLAADAAWLQLGSRRIATATLAGTRLTVGERPHHTWEMMMDHDSTDGRPTGELLDDAELDELAMKLVFEVGRFDMPLGELRSLGAGHVFELDRDPEQAVDIVVNGRRIGSGQLVRIGERLGVRVLRLGQDG